MIFLIIFKISSGTPDGDVSGSQVFFSGGKVADFIIDTEISSSGLIIRNLILK